MSIKKLSIGSIGVAIVLFLASISIASAALTFSSTTMSGDVGIAIDGSSTISIGTSSATGITIGRAGQTVAFPGTISATNLAITALGTSGSNCLTVNGSGNVATTTCGTGSASGLTTANFATTSISQWNNDAGYVTSTGGSVGLNGLSGSNFLFVGAGGLSVSTSSTSTITFSQSAGGGSSTQVYQGFGITATPNPINNTGTIALTTSTVYQMFAASNPITYNNSTGAFSFANSGVSSGSYTCTNLTVSSSGLLTAASNGTCGVGGGSVTINGVSSSTFTFASSSPITLTASGTQFTWGFANPGYITLNGLSAVSPIVYNSSTGQFSWTNSNNYISTSTNLTTANFSSPNISQWTNNVGYVTSTGVSSITIGGISSSTFQTLAPLSVSATGTIIFTNPGYISTSTGLTVSNFTSPNISQWTNNVPYLTSSTGVTSVNGSNGAITISSSSLGVVYNPNWITTSSISINGVQGNVFTGLATSTGLASYNVSSANSYIGVATTTNGATLTFSTSSFGSNAFNSTAFLTTSTYNASMTIVTAAPLTGGASLTNGSTISLGLTTPIASAYGGTGTTTALGTNAFTSTAFLPIATTATSTWVLTSNGSTWAAAAPSTSGSVSTSSALTADYFPYWANATGGLMGTSSIFYASSTGYIGIGTTNPVGLLDVVGSSNSTSTAFTGARAMSIINTDVTNGNMEGFDFRTNDASGTLVTGGKILSINTSHASSGISADMDFRTNNAGTMGSRMYITSAGNVGIGTSAPSSTLHVVGTETVTATTTVLGNAAFGTSTIPSGVNEIHSYGASTSTLLMFGATSTVSSSYNPACIAMVPTGVTTGTTVYYLDVSSAGALQISASGCL